MPKSHKPVTRKTENSAINPNGQFYVDTQFIAPYGVPIRRSHIEEFTTDGDGDLGPINHAGINKNEAHARMMAQDYTFPHERRVLGEGWDVHEATSFEAQKEQLDAEREYARMWAEAQKEYGWLDEYYANHARVPENSELSVKQLQEKYSWLDIHFTPEFEEMVFSDEELLSTGNQLSPIFSSTGRVIKENNTTKDSPVNMVRSTEHEAFVKKLAGMIRHEDSDFTPVNIVIPSYVARQHWLDYCLNRINPPGIDITKDIPKVSMCLFET